MHRCVQGDFVIMNICNMNNQSKLYSGDYRVHYRTHPGMQAFLPLRSRVKYTKAESSILRFSHKFDSTAETFFAFCIPWSCEENDRFLKCLVQRYIHSPSAWQHQTSHRAASPARSNISVGSSSDASRSSPDTSPAANQQSHKATDPVALASAAAADSQCKAGIYFHSQTLARSLQGRPLHVLTITDLHGVHTSAGEPDLPGVFLKIQSLLPCSSAAQPVTRQPSEQRHTCPFLCPSPQHIRTDASLLKTTRHLCSSQWLCSHVQVGLQSPVTSLVLRPHNTSRVHFETTLVLGVGHNTLHMRT